MTIAKDLMSHRIIFLISGLGISLQFFFIIVNIFYLKCDESLSESAVAYAVKSPKLKTVHIASLAACIPIAFDVLLDMFSKEKDVDWSYRPFFLIGTAVPSIVFVFGENYITPIIYLSIYHFGIITFETAIHSMLIRINYNRTKTLHLIISHSLYIFCACIKAASLSFYASWIDSTRLLALAGITGTVIVTTYYGIKTVSSSFKHFNFHDSNYKLLNMSKDELIFSLYIVLFILLTGFIQHARFIEGLLSFRNLTDDYFIKVQTYFIIFGAFVTILPGRLARIKAELSQQIINTKGHFVRYVSHEIRSPLFVVSAGLEMTIQELKTTQNVSNTLIELVSDVYDSTTTAINLLNDLLQYENMELDSFKLDLAWSGLNNLFGLKINTLTALAKKSSVQFLLDDSLNLFGTEKNPLVIQQMIAQETSDFFNGSYNYNNCNNNNEDDGEKNHEIVLRVDRFRIDQILRNLIVNAIKFTPKGGSVLVRSSIKRRKEFLSSKILQRPLERFYKSTSIKNLRTSNNNSSSSSKGSGKTHNNNSSNIDDDHYQSNSTTSTPSSSSQSQPSLSLEQQSQQQLTQSQSSSQQSQSQQQLTQSSLEDELLQPIGDIRVEVIDSGVGIAIENQGKIFSEFTQFNRNQLQAGGGSGLGLWISRRIAEYHHGKVDFHSAGVGKGSTFYLELPVYKPPDGVLQGEGEQEINSGLYGCRTDSFTALNNMATLNNNTAYNSSSSSNSSNNNNDDNNMNVSGTSQSNNNLTINTRSLRISSSTTNSITANNTATNTANRRVPRSSTSSNSNNNNSNNSNSPTFISNNNNHSNNSVNIHNSNSSNSPSRNTIRFSTGNCPTSINSYIITTANSSFDGNYSSSGKNLMNSSNNSNNNNNNNNYNNNNFRSSSSSINSQNSANNNTNNNNNNNTITSTATTSAVYPNCRLLIVDDSSTNLKMVRRLLESASEVFPYCVIEEADDGDTAAEKVAQSLLLQSNSGAYNNAYNGNISAYNKPYDVVLMDSLMHRMNGNQAAIIMRKQYDYNGVIIGVTGNARSEEIAAFKQCGVDEVLAKPITRVKLVETISAVLASRR